MRSYMGVWFAIPFVLSGCATLKTDVLDKSGDPIGHVIIQAEYQDVPAAKKLSTQNLTQALRKAVEDELRAASNGMARVDSDITNGKTVPAEVVQRWPGATHLLRIDAYLVSYSSHKPGIWSACAAKDKDKKCQPGIVGEGSTSAQARVEGYLMDLKTRRIVIHIDALNSPRMPVGDETPMAAAIPLAKQFGKIIREAGLLGNEARANR